jgi:argininosuccinate lyase
LPFRTAHSIAALLLKARNEDPGASLAEALAKASRALVGRPIEYSEERLTEIMSPQHFVMVRQTLGGPAPGETARAIAEQRALLDGDRKEWQKRRDHLIAAEQKLAFRVRQI